MGAQPTGYPQDPRGMSIPSSPQATWSPAHEQSRLDARATKPAGNSYANPYVAPAPSFQPASSGGAEVDLRNLDSYWTHQDAYTPPEATGGTEGYSGGGGAIADDNSSWRNRLYAERAASANRNSGGGGSVLPPKQNIAPMEALKSPDMPEYKSPEYNAPKEDPNVYKQTRREEMGAGMRELREGTREAISSAQSLDNPNARAKFIQQSLKGYGQGLEKVAAGASRSARSEAGRKRADQLADYRLQHAQKSDNYLRSYQAEIATISADFAAQQSAQMANFNASMNPNVNVGGEGSTLSATAKRALPTYGANVPFMGYM